MANVNFKTPLGELQWVVISGEGKPDLQGRMKYSANVLISKEEGEALKTTLDAYWEANRPKSVKLPKSTGLYPHMIKTDEVDPDTDKAIYVEDPEGRVEVRLKTNTTWPKDNKPVTIKVLRANGNPINLGDKEIGNVSIGVLHGSYGIYSVKMPNGKISDAGITMYLSQVQLQKFVAFEGDNTPVEAISEVEDDGLDDVDMTEALDGPKI